jgi:uncharacterized repeat protein (TIGR01451 family)
MLSTSQLVIVATTLPSASDRSPSSIARQNRNRSIARFSLGLCLLLAVAALFFAESARAQNVTLARVVTTYAGNGTAGFAGDSGPAISAELQNPWGVAVDKAGNVYVADQTNNRIRKVDTNGNITTVAGNGTAGYIADGVSAASTELNNPYNVTLDSAGNLYIADYYNSRVRKVDTNGIITTVAGNGTYGSTGDGGAATSAELSYPIGLAVDSAGNLYIGDYLNNRVRKVDTTGTITTVAGNGTAGYTGDGTAATGAEINGPNGVALDSTGNLYIADYYNNVIRKVSTAGIITTVAGNGTAGFSGDGGMATSAELSVPWTVTVDSAGNLFIGDEGNDRVRRVDTSGTITTIAGNGTLGYSGDAGPALSAELYYPTGVALDSAGYLYVGDLSNNRIRKVSPGGQAPVSFGSITVGQTGTSQPVVLSINADLTIASSQTSGDFTVTNPSDCHSTFTAGMVCTLEVQFAPTKPGPRWFPLVVTDGSSNQYTFGLEGSGVGSALAFTPGIISTVAGTGTAGFSGDSGAATSAELNSPSAVAVDSAGNLYITDHLNYRIRKVDTSGTITTVAGTGTGGYNGDNIAATSAELYYPFDVALDSAGNLYIADQGNQRVRKVNSSGTITTVAGTGTAGYNGDNITATSAQLYEPTGVAVDSAGNVYTADYGNNRVRKVDTTSTISTVAGTGTAGYNGDNIAAASAELNGPTGVAVDSAGNLYIAELNGQRIRKVNISGTITTVAGTGTAGYNGDNITATSAEIDNPYKVALDAAGDLYITDFTNQRIRKVDTSGTITTVAGTGTAGYNGDNAGATSAELNSPIGVAADGAAKLYVAEYNNSRIRNVDVTTSALSFGPVPQNQTSSAQRVAVSDVGTAQLNFNSFGFSSNFISQEVGNDCSTSISVGATCELGVAFAPTQPGDPLTGSLTVGDDAFNSPQFVSLTGNSTSQLSITVSGTGGGAVEFDDADCSGNTGVDTGHCSETYDAGSVVQLTAATDEGSTFAGWGGACASYSTNTMCTVTLNSDTNVTATFNLASVITFPLTVTLVGTGTGTVTDTSEVTNISCTETHGTVPTGTCSANPISGSTVVLTANPGNDGSTFAGWTGDCSGSSTCTLQMTSAHAVTANFVPPPTPIILTFNPSTSPETQVATFDCPTNPNPTPSTPCTDPNGHSLQLTVQGVSSTFSVTVLATEIPPSQENGDCSTPGAVTTDFDCRFATFFTFGTAGDGGALVPLCDPYANGNCVHYNIYSGTPGAEPNPNSYTGPVNWFITWNSDTYVPPSPYASIPRLYDDPDSPVTPSSAVGTDCTQFMTINGSPTTYKCQFEFDITTSFDASKKVDSGIGGTTRQFNDVVVAFPPATVSQLTAASAPDNANVTFGTGIGYTVTVTNNGPGSAAHVTLYDPLPSGTGVHWFLTPSVSGCSITSSAGSQVLNCMFSSLAASASRTVHVSSAAAGVGTYINAATITINNQQLLTIASLTVTATFSLRIAPTSVNFGNVYLGLPAVQFVTVTNNGSNSIAISNIKVTTPGTAVGDFGGVSTCTPFIMSMPGTLGAGKSCVIAVGFLAKTFIATATATLTITDTAAGSPQTVPLTVTVINPQAQLSLSSLNFGNQKTGTTSAAKSVTLKNSGTTPLILSGLSISGNFAFGTVAGTNCTSSTTLAPGATCVIGVSFKPNSTGSKSGSIKISDNALNSSQSISLSGKGT